MLNSNGVFLLVINTNDDNEALKYKKATYTMPFN
jgi:hypothetical protein